MYAHKHARAADKHSKGKGTPVFVPWKAVGAVPIPCVLVLRAYTIDEDKEHGREEDKRDELKDEAREEYLYANKIGCMYNETVENVHVRQG